MNMEEMNLIELEGEDLFHGILAKYDSSKFSDDDVFSLKCMFGIIEDLDLTSNFHAPYNMVRSGKQDICEMLLLLRHGKNIRISADTKEGTKSIDISEGMILELQEMMNMYLCEKYMTDESMLSDDYLKQEVDMGKAIEARERQLQGRKTQKKEYSYIPKIGQEVSSLLSIFEPQLSKLSSISEQYRIIGDFICYNKKAPSCSPEEWEAMGKKEQYRMVKSWIDSASKPKKETRKTSFEVKSKQGLWIAYKRMIEYMILGK